MDITRMIQIYCVRNVILLVQLVLVKEQQTALLALLLECSAMGSVSPVRLATSSPSPAASATHATLPVLSVLDQMPTSAQTVQENYNWTPGPPSVFPAVTRTLSTHLPAVTVLAPMAFAPPQPGRSGQVFLQQCWGLSC